MSAARVDILGVPVDVLTRQGLMERIHGYVDEGGRRTVAYLNMHVLDNALALPDLAAFLRGVDTCYCDGEGVRLVGRLLATASRSA